MTDGKKRTNPGAMVTGVEHKYTALLYIGLGVPIICRGVFAIAFRSVARPRVA